MGYCVLRTHPTNFKNLLNMIFNIMLVSNQSGNITPRLPTCARHVVTLAELNFFGSSSRQAEQESGIAKDKSSPTSPPHGLHGAGIPASPHGRFIKPASTTSRPASAGPHYCFFKLVSITPTYFDSSADIEASTSRLDRGLRHLFINLLRRLRVTSRLALSR